jgi:phage shock protein E
MINFIKQILGLGPKVNYLDLVKNGAQLIDVRTPAEFNQGNIANSKNIPLQTIANNLSKFDKNKTIIVFCASGMRSANAMAILKTNGYKNVVNAGSWLSLKNKL